MKNKFLTCILVSFAILLSSCGMISIETLPAENEQNVSFIEKKNNLISNIQNTYSDDNYFYDDWHYLQLLRQECINIINEIEEENEIESVYNRCVLSLSTLKTKLDYFHLLINTDGLFDDYYENTKTEILEKNQQNWANMY